MPRLKVTFALLAQRAAARRLVEEAAQRYLNATRARVRLLERVVQRLAPAGGGHQLLGHGSGPRREHRHVVEAPFA